MIDIPTNYVSMVFFRCFLQSDQARHIEVLANEIYTILTHMEEFLLCSGDLQQVVTLHQTWKQFTVASKHGN